MKKEILSIFIFSAFFGCQKPFDTDNNCTKVKVTLSAPSCKHVGVIIDGTLYPTDDLPDQYAVEGKIFVLIILFGRIIQSVYVVEEPKCILVQCIS